MQEMAFDVEVSPQSYEQGSGEHEDLETANSFEYIWYE